MRRSRRHRHQSAAVASSLVLVAVLAWAVGRAQADALYTITDLGNRYAAALNNSGDVVGNDNLGGDGGAPFIYHGSGPAAGTFTDLSATLGTSAVIEGLSDSGLIVGTLYTGTSSRGFVADGNAVTLIQPPSGNSSDNTTASAVNNSGEVIGTYSKFVGGSPPGTEIGGYIYTPNSMTDLGIGNSPVAINNAGIVTGGSFYYKDGSLSYPGNLPGRIDLPSAINDANQVVGSAGPISGDTYTNTTHAYFYDHNTGQLSDLGTLGGLASFANSINASGQIVGESLIGGDVNHAFIYQNSIMDDLNNLIPASTGWTLEFGVAINDKGQIIGYGTGPDGQLDSFLLTPAGDVSPVPEPSTLAFFGLAAAAVALRRAWRRR